MGAVIDVGIGCPSCYIVLVVCTVLDLFLLNRSCIGVIRLYTGMLFKSRQLVRGRFFLSQEMI